MGPLVLIALLARQAGPDTAGAASPLARPAKVVVVALAGKLSQEEISSGSGLPAGGLGKAGPEGVFLERVAFTLPDASSRLEELRACLVPSDVALVTVRLGGGVHQPPLPGPPSRPLQRLHARFGTPPPRSSEEAKAVALLRKAAGAPDNPRPRASDGGARLDAVRTARVSLVVIDAVGAAAEDVRRRSEAVHRVLEAAGDGAHVFIACIPEDGAGSVLARGPLFRSGQIVRGEKPATIVRAAVRSILEGRAQAKDVGEAADLFRERVTE